MKQFARPLQWDEGCLWPWERCGYSEKDEQNCQNEYLKYIRCQM